MESKAVFFSWLSWFCIFSSEEEYFNFTKMVRPNIYFDIEQFLRTTMAERYPGNSESVSEHMSCISDKECCVMASQSTPLMYPLEK